MYQLPLLEGRLLSQSTMHMACSIPTLLYPNPYRLHNQPSGPHSPFILPKWAPNGELCTPSTAERRMPTFHRRFCCLSFQLHFSHLYQSLEGCICCWNGVQFTAFFLCCSMETLLRHQPMGSRPHADHRVCSRTANAIREKIFSR